ncbi:MAG: TlpA family protein disulfide reductase [Gemmatimonadetes bacterium]|nr:TlpA family protein disulfide reductase [Gemmatimonadota bacterium]
MIEISVVAALIAGVVSFLSARSRAQALILPVVLLVAGCGWAGGEQTAEATGDGDAADRGGAARESIPGRPENSVLPDERLSDLNGRPTPLRSSDDQVTVLNFWATWCVPCLQEIPEFVRLHRERSGHSVEVVGVAVDSGDPADIRAFAAEHDMTYTIVTANQRWVRRHFEVFGLPVTLIVDREGRIRRRLIGPQTGADLAAVVDAYM